VTGLTFLRRTSCGLLAYVSRPLPAVTAEPELAWTTLEVRVQVPRYRAPEAWLAWTWVPVSLTPLESEQARESARLDDDAEPPEPTDESDEEADARVDAATARAEARRYG
jgi:hypothetical protein